ncbi:hypothetical protein B7494_g5528 [Chlorociboria aeruginascens]|nr:hypothetical protein B7494_g5528 [Chlorociboria aeruginascens]
MSYKKEKSRNNQSNSSFIRVRAQKFRGKSTPNVFRLLQNTTKSTVLWNRSERFTISEITKDTSRLNSILLPYITSGPIRHTMATDTGLPMTRSQTTVRLFPNEVEPATIPEGDNPRIMIEIDDCPIIWIVHINELGKSGLLRNLFRNGELKTRATRVPSTAPAVLDAYLEMYASQTEFQIFSCPGIHQLSLIIGLYVLGHDWLIDQLASTAFSHLNREFNDEAMTKSGMTTNDVYRFAHEIYSQTMPGSGLRKMITNQVAKQIIAGSRVYVFDKPTDTTEAFKRDVQMEIGRLIIATQRTVSSAAHADSTPQAPLAYKFSLAIWVSRAAGFSLRDTTSILQVLRPQQTTMADPLKKVLGTIELYNGPEETLCDDYPKARIHFYSPYKDLIISVNEMKKEPSYFCDILNSFDFNKGDKINLKPLYPPLLEILVVRMELGYTDRKLYDASDMSGNLYIDLYNFAREFGIERLKRDAIYHFKRLILGNE